MHNVALKGPRNNWMNSLDNTLSRDIALPFTFTPTENINVDDIM